MLKNRLNVAFVTALAAIALPTIVLAQQQPGTGAKAPAGQTAQPKAADPTVTAAQGAVAKAIDRAAKDNKYVFVYIYRTEDEPAKAARKNVDAAMEKLADRALTAAVNVTDPLEQGFVAKYRLDRAPTPMVLAIAPNGAVTRSFTGQLDVAPFETAFVSPGTQKCVKALQDRKLVFICVQNGKTQHNAEVMQGVKDFVADAQYAKTTEIIMLDPADAAEETFLQQLKVDPKTQEAVVVFLAPPGAMVGTYQGETKKDVLVAATKTAAKGCDPKSGCCPAPKKPAGGQPQAQPQPQPPTPGTTGNKR